MKKSRIQSIRISRLKVSKKEYKEISDTLIDYHKKAIKNKLASNNKNSL